MAFSNSMSNYASLHKIPTFLTFIRNCHSKMKKTKSSTNYCIEMVRLNENENFLCSLLLPDKVRQAAFAVRAFNIEIAKVSDHTKEKHISAMRMKFWYDTLDNIYNKTPPQHPVAIELARAVSEHNLLKRNLKRLISARADNLLLRFDSIDEMEKYCEETVSPIYYLILQSAGVKSIDADHAASHLGKAQGLVTMLRSIPHNVSSRCLPLPNDLLASNKVSQESVFRSIPPKELCDVVFEVASKAKIHLDKARSLNHNIAKEHCVIFLPSIAVECYLEKLRKQYFDVFDPSLGRRSATLGFKLFWNKMKKSY